MHHVARSLVPGPLRHLLPKTSKRVVVVGGGPTGLFCADRLRHHFEVTVVDGKDYFEFTPSILRAVVDPAHHSHITFNYRDVLERQLGVEFMFGEATSINVAAETSSLGHAGTVRVMSPTAEHRLNFDYCVVAVGASNGFWKPRLAREPPPSAGAIAAAQVKAGRGNETAAERTLDLRRQTLQDLRESIGSAKGAVIVGAGLVGVELAAELVHFFPRLKVALVDGAPDVLPQLGDTARDYARNWLQQHNVVLRVGRPFRPESLKPDYIVLSCVGTTSRVANLFSDSAVLRRKGQLRVNPFMQVLERVVPLGTSLTSMDSYGSSATDPDIGSDRAEVQTLAQGRIYAVGDAASVEGVPTAQVIFHGEEMAAVAVANIEASEGIVPPLSLSQARRELEPNQPFLCCTSLGPLDGMFSTQRELLATGTFAAIQKQMIETTKMSALKGELAGSMLWYPVH